MYGYDAAKGSFTVVGSRARYYDLIALLILVTGGTTLLSDDAPGTLTWFCCFAGFAMHYWNGLRNGVLSSRFFLFSWGLTVYEAESPLAYYLAAIIEGLWVLVFFLVFVFSL